MITILSHINLDDMISCESKPHTVVVKDVVIDFDTVFEAKNRSNIETNNKLDFPGMKISRHSMLCSP